MPTTCSSMPSVTAFTLVAGLDSSMFWKQRTRRTGGLRAFRRFPARGRRSLYPRWIACSWLCGLVPENRQRFGCSGQCLKFAAAARGDQRVCTGQQISIPVFPKWLVPGSVIVMCFSVWSSSAWAYRPFDGTDAAVAAPGELEIELQPAGRLRESGTTSLIAPATVINYGLSEGWEAVLEGQGQTPLSPSGPTSLTTAGAFLKHVIQPGSPQDKTGPSVATEFGMLRPSIIGVSWRADWPTESRSWPMAGLAGRPSTGSAPWQSSTTPRAPPSGKPGRFT